MGGRKEVSGGPKISHRINNLFLQMLTLYLTKKKKNNKKSRGLHYKTSQGPPTRPGQTEESGAPMQLPLVRPDFTPRVSNGSRNPG